MIAIGTTFLPIAFAPVIYTYLWPPTVAFTIGLCANFGQVAFVAPWFGTIIPPRLSRATHMTKKEVNYR